MYNINDKNTQSVAEAVKKVIENKKDFKPHMMYDPKTGKEYEAKTYEDHIKMKDMGYVHEKPSKKDEAEVQAANKDFVNLHTVDKKDDPEKEKQVESKEKDVEEGNEFTKAAAKAKLAGEDEFEFDGKTYPTEISQDAAEKILGKKEKSNVNEIEIDPITGKLIGAGAPKKESVELDEKVKPNLTKIVNIRREIVKVQTKIDKAVFDGDAKTVNKLSDELHKLRMKLVNFYNESVELDEKAPTMSQGMSRALDQMYQLAGSLAKGSRLNKGVNKDLGGNYNSDFGKMEKAMGVVTGIFGDIIQDYKSFKEEVEIEEATKPEVFVKGGNAKITKREVDSLLSKIFINNKLAKAVESNPAYKDGYKGKVKKNPFKKDTIDFHLFVLGQQSAEAE